MSKTTYNLLSLEATKQADHPFRLSGALTEQGVEVTEKFASVIKAAKVMARLKPSHQINLLSVEFDVDPEQRSVSLSSSGLLSNFFRGEEDHLKQRIANLGRPLAYHDGGLVYNLYLPPIPSPRFINSLARLVMQGDDPVTPSTCTLHVTTRCQLNCYHCSAARYKAPERQELTTEEWLSVIKQAEKLGVYIIVFTGGEPLLREDLCTLISAVDRERAHANIFTNGLLLTAENVTRLRAAGLFAAMVSLDDPRPEKHEELRRVPGGFQRTVDGMKRALDAGLFIGLSTYVSPRGLREGRVEEMIELGRSIGVQELTVFDIIPTGKLLPMDRDQLLSPADKAKLIAMEDEYNRKPGYPHIITQAKINGPQGEGCFAGANQFYMTAYGDFDPCDFTPLTFGNIRDDTLATLWTRLLAHPAYQHPCDHCRMQDPEFRHLYIDDIPEDALLPWPVTEEARDTPHSPTRESQLSTLTTSS
jgi:MoaA/NifB/PqqE/SkfB family radical SAM enzyme